MPSCIGCGAHETEYDPCTCPPSCDGCEENARLAAWALEAREAMQPCTSISCKLRHPSGGIGTANVCHCLNDIEAVLAKFPGEGK